MAKTYYAWSMIQAGTLEKPVTVQRGAKVTQDGLGISKADFDAMIESGSVRDRPYPAPDDYPGSAIDYLRDQLAEATSVSDLEEASANSELQAVLEVES